MLITGEGYQALHLWYRLLLLHLLHYLTEFQLTSNYFPTPDCFCPARMEKMTLSDDLVFKTEII